MDDDFDLGQVLVDLGFTTPERVREALSVQQRLRSAGETPRPLAQILLDNGSVTAGQLEAARRRRVLGETDRFPEIPGYSLERILGRGGTGIVYEGRQVSIDRPVAVKILSPRFSNDPAYLRRFLRETRAAARLNHPNLVAAIDAGEANGIHYFVMERVRGETLAARILEEGRLGEREALEIGLQIARALDHAARHGLIHRDIKPENVLLSEDGIAKICDLGLVHSSRAAVAHEEAGFGTVRYVSPEQAREAADLDVRSDLYSLGATLYHALAGHPPFDGTRKSEILQKHLTEPPVPLIQIRPELSAATSALVGKLMQKDRILRHASAAEVVEEIERALREVQARPEKVLPSPVPSRPPVSRRSLVRPEKRGIGLPVAVVLAALALTFVVVWNRFPEWFRGRAEGDGETGVSAGRSDSVSDPEADRRAKEHLQAIVDQATLDEEFARAAEILQQLGEYRARWKGTSWGREAAEEERRYSEKAKAAARSALSQLQKEATEAIGRGKLREAAEIYGRFPSRFRIWTELASEVQEEVTRLRRQIAERTAADRALLEEEVRTDRLDEALDRLTDMEGYAGEEQRAELAERRRQIRQRKIERYASVEREIADRYFRVDVEYRRAVGERRFQDAAGIVASFLYLETWDETRRKALLVPGVDHESLQKEVKDWDCSALLARTGAVAASVRTPAEVTTGEMALLDLRNAAGLSLLLARALESAEKMVSSRETVPLSAYGGLRCGFERVQGKLRCRVEGKSPIEIDPRRHLPAADLVLLAERGVLDSEKDAALLYWGGLLHFYCGGPGDIPAASVRLARAESLGFPGAVLFRTRVDEALRSRAGEDILSRLEAARRHRESGRWRAVKAEVEALSRHSGHAALAEHAVEVERLRAEAESKVAALDALGREVRGFVDEAGGSRTVAYDFTSAEQLEAFIPVETEKGRWKWKKGALEKETTAWAALQWRKRVRGDVAVEFDLTAMDDRNIAATVFYQPGQSKHYSFVLGLDIVSGRKDPENLVEAKHRMPRHCIVKYPVSVDPERWVLPGFWDAWKSRLVGESVSPFTFETRRTYRVRAERTGRTLRLLLDGIAHWEGEDEEYNEGYVLLQSDSRVQIDNLVLTVAADR